MDEFEFLPGEVLDEAGHAGEQAWLILEGQVELLMGPPEALQRVRVAGPGEVIGEMSLVDERPRDSTARAISEGRAVAIPREAFEQHLLRAPLPILECLRALFERLRMHGPGPVSHNEPSHSTEQPPPPPIDSPSHHGPVEFPVSHGEPGTWSVVIHPLSRKATESLPEEGLLVTRFPLRIGRAAAADEGEAMGLNDLWLLDESPYNISRNHCEIFLGRSGPELRDRGSHLGCIVNESPVGGRAPNRSRILEPGENVVVVGSRMSPYQFRVVVNRSGH